MSILKIQPASQNSILPTFLADKGYILYANEDKEIHPGVSTCIKAGFKMAFPSNYCAIIVSHDICKLLGGLIDSDYRGEVACIASSNIPLSMKRGNPIGRMYVLEISLPKIEDITSTPVEDRNRLEVNTL